jgi:hypothetical protein
MDDESGWHGVLIELWTPHVRDAVVARVEDATVGRRGVLVRTLASPEEVPEPWTEALHDLVIASIRDETGADLDHLGSQAAWECYEQVWTALAARWADGGALAVVPLGAEPEVDRLIRGLPSALAAEAGADVSGRVPDPLWLGGRLRVDLEGLESGAARAEDALSAEVRTAVRAIVRAIEA